MNGKDAPAPTDSQGTVVNVSSHVNDIRSLSRSKNEITGASQEPAALTGHSDNPDLETVRQKWLKTLEQALDTIISSRFFAHEEKDSGADAPSRSPTRR